MKHMVIKFMVGGRWYNTPCKTVLNAESFTVKFFTERHEVLATVSDKCYFSSIDNISLTGLKTDFYIGEYNSKDLTRRLCNSFESFYNTSIPFNEKISGFLSVDHVLDRIIEIVKKIANTEKNIENSLDILIHDTTKTTEETMQDNECSGIFSPTEIFDTEEECDYWFKAHKFDVSLNRVFIIKDIFAKRTSEGIKKYRHYTAEITLKNIALESGLIHLMNEIKNHGFEVIESDFFGCKSFIDCYVSSGDRNILFIENNESGLYIQYQYRYEVECDDMEKNLNLNNFLKALIKALGIEKSKEVRYRVQGVNVFFEYKQNMYKCYTPQSKLYKLSGQRFKLITWRDLKKESDETDNISGSMYTARSPPYPLLLNLPRNKLMKREVF